MENTSKLNEVLKYFQSLAKDILVKPPGGICHSCIAEMYLDEKFTELIRVHGDGHDHRSSVAQEMEKEFTL